jgi:hypothetical protein
MLKAEEGRGGKGEGRREKGEWKAGVGPALRPMIEDEFTDLPISRQRKYKLCSCGGIRRSEERL